MRLTHLLLWATLGALLPGTARAQIDAPSPIQEVDPDARPSGAGEDSEEEHPPARKAAPAHREEDAAPVPAKAPSKKAAAKEPEPPREARAPPKPPLVSRLTDAALEEAFGKWRKATAARDTRAAEAAQKELATLKAELGAADLEAYALAFARASEERERAKDPAGAVGNARAAVELAPDFPFAHLRLAGAYFFADITEPGRIFGALGAAARAFARDPRYLRPAAMDLAASAFFGLLATAIAVVAVLFLRRARYFLHDFHHVFPRGAAPWQTTAVAALLLGLPLVFRLGAVPSLFALVIAVSLYLTLAERLVASALLVLLALVPLVTAEVVNRTDFAGTPAEDVYIAERGGRYATDAAKRILRRVQAGNPTYGELYALGRLEYRRGALDEAIAHFKAAGSLRNSQAPLLTNLGNALLVKGDFDGAAEMYRGAMAADAAFAPPAYNLAQLHGRRAIGLSQDGAAKEKLLHDEALRTATLLDPALSARAEPPEDRPLANLMLISPPLPPEELATLASLSERGVRIRAQLSSSLLGELDPPLAYLYAFGLGLAAVLLGFAARALSISKECQKCGRPVCRRCDPELSRASELCNQCVHVFARKGAVAATMRVRKQIEISRHQDRSDKLSYVLGLVCSGAGHLFSGFPLRGTVYAFFFLCTIFAVLFRQGVLRSPYAELPSAVKLVPAALILAGVYFFSLRGLYKRQSR